MNMSQWIGVSINNTFLEHKSNERPKMDGLFVSSFFLSNWNYKYSFKFL